jgi:hypothetical protein
MKYGKIWGVKIGKIFKAKIYIEISLGFKMRKYDKEFNFRFLNLIALCVKEFRMILNLRLYDDFLNRFCV